MRTQMHGTVTTRRPTGGGQLQHTSLYEIELDDGRRLTCDYTEIASDGFRTLAPGEAVWCSVSEEDPTWAVYVVPIRSYTPRQLLGLPDIDALDEDPVAELWF